MDHIVKNEHAVVWLEFKIIYRNRIWLSFLLISLAKSCGRPNDIPNGKIIGYVFSFKEKIRYECNEGYNLKGPSYRTCQDNEKWGDKDPICEGKIFDNINIEIISYVFVISHVSITVLCGRYIFSNLLLLSHKLNTGESDACEHGFESHVLE